MQEAGNWPMLPLYLMWNIAPIIFLIVFLGRFYFPGEISISNDFIDAVEEAEVVNCSLIV